MARPLPHYFLSHHARSRLDSRGVSTPALEAALRWGRRTWSHGDFCCPGFELQTPLVERLRSA
jgi:hypothetical protein